MKLIFICTAGLLLLSVVATAADVTQKPLVHTVTAQLPKPGQAPSHDDKTIKAHVVEVTTAKTVPPKGKPTMVNVPSKDDSATTTKTTVASSPMKETVASLPKERKIRAVVASKMPVIIAKTRKGRSMVSPKHRAPLPKGRKMRAVPNPKMSVIISKNRKGRSLNTLNRQAPMLKGRKGRASLKRRWPDSKGRKIRAVDTSNMPEALKLTKVPPVPISPDVSKTPEIQKASTVPAKEKGKMMRMKRAEPPTLQSSTNHSGNKNDNKNPCDIECTKLEFNPICATNGICLHEFANQCVMDTFNCLHPKLGFKATKNESCRMNWLKRCTENDLKD